MLQSWRSQDFYPVTVLYFYKLSNLTFTCSDHFACCILIDLGSTFGHQRLLALLFMFTMRVVWD